MQPWPSLAAQRVRAETAEHERGARGDIVATATDPGPLEGDPKCLHTAMTVTGRTVRRQAVPSQRGVTAAAACSRSSRSPWLAVPGSMSGWLRRSRTRLWRGSTPLRGFSLTAWWPRAPSPSAAANRKHETRCAQFWLTGPISEPPAATTCRSLPVAPPGPDCGWPASSDLASQVHQAAQASRLRRAARRHQTCIHGQRASPSARPQPPRRRHRSRAARSDTQAGRHLKHQTSAPSALT